MAVAFGPTSCSFGLVPKSKLLHRPETQYGFVPKHSLHGGKNIALRAEKPILAMRSFFSGAQRSGAFSFAEHRMHLSIAQASLALHSVFTVFASEDVLRCGAMCDGGVAGAGACSQAQSHDSGT